MRHNFEDLEQYFVQKSISDNRSRLRDVMMPACCSDYHDSVDAFISRHSVKNDVISIDNIRKLQRHLQLNDININNDDSLANFKMNNNSDTEIFVSKIIKYNRRLDKVIVKLMKALKTERDEGDLKEIISLLQDKHKRNVLSLAKDSYRKLLKSEENLIDERENRKLLLKPSTDLSCTVTGRYVKSENMISYIKEIKSQNTYCSNGICCPRSSCTNTIHLHRDEGQTNLYSSMNSMTIRKMNKENLTLYPTIRVPYVRKSFIPKHAMLQVDPKESRRERSVNRDTSQQRALRGPVQRLDNVRKKILKNTSSKVETKIDDLVKTINLLIEEIQAQKSSKVDKKIETINEDKDDSVHVAHHLRRSVVLVERREDASVNTDVSIVCARSARAESRFDFSKYRNKLSNAIGIKSGVKINTPTVARTASIGSMATVVTSDKAVDVNRPITIRVKSTQETAMAGESSTSSNEDNMSTLIKGTNTDPLGVIALLRVSADTIKQLISNVPSIDYYSYLPSFQVSNYLEKGELQFVCDICGAAFNKASVLNDHIKSHELGFARSCGVCQHVLSSEQGRGSELFKCRYCGQRFTRAYCCELHQQSCAKRFGLRASTSSLFPLP